MRKRRTGRSSSGHRVHGSPSWLAIAAACFAAACSPVSIDLSGSGAVLHAIDGQDPMALAMLLDAGAAIDGETEDGEPALIFAISVHDAYALELLLEHGADPNTEFEGRSALAIAAATLDGLAVILLEHGAELLPGEAPEVLRDLAAEGSIETLERLLDEGLLPLSGDSASSDPQDRQDEYDPLLAACAGAHREIVQLLVEHGATADPSAMVAAAFESDDPEFVDALLSEFPEVSLPESWIVRLAEMETGEAKTRWLAKWSRRAGALQPQNLDAALEIAAGQLDARLTEELISLGASPKRSAGASVHAAVAASIERSANVGVARARAATLATLDALARAGASFDPLDDEGFSPLSEALAEGPGFLVDALLARGASARLPIGPEQQGAPAWLLAARAQSLHEGPGAQEIFEIQNEEDGLVPRYEVREADVVGLTRSLIEAGADVARRDRNGHTAEHFAQRLALELDDPELGERLSRLLAPDA